MHPATVELASLPPSRGEIPFFLIGESMGGAVSILAASSGKFGFDGVLLVAPMCAIAPVSPAQASCSRSVVAGFSPDLNCAPSVMPLLYALRLCIGLRDSGRRLASR